MADTVTSSTAYAQDAEGNTFRCSDIIYKGERITYGPPMLNPCTLFESLDTFEAREDDIWLLSYAKSGTHWLYEIVSILCSGDLKPCKDFKRKSMVDSKADMSDFVDMPSPRILNTHLRHKNLPQAVLDKSKLIYVIRNPKSVAVSWYFHTIGLKYYEYKGTLAGYLPSYLEGYYSIWGTWFDSVQEMWCALRGRKNALIISYEDLKKDTPKVIKEIADFLCLNRTVEFCQEVAKLASFETMSKHVGKDKEQSQARPDAWQNKKDGFFRKGSITDWKNHLTVAQNEHFDTVYDQKMERYPELKKFVMFE